MSRPRGSRERGGSAKKPSSKVCSLCGATYSPASARQKYCSPSCLAAGDAARLLRACANCGEQFSPGKSAGKYCSRTCSAASSSKRNTKYATDAERQAANAISVRKTRYGITNEQFLALLVAQDNKCAICRRPFLDKVRTRRPHVDHSHKTGEVRGLLDDWCNRQVLGSLNDSAERARTAAAYLENPPSRAVFAQIEGVPNA